LVATYVIGQKIVYEMSVDEKTHRNFFQIILRQSSQWGKKHAKTVAIKKAMLQNADEMWLA
jgi:hypothetical protein